MRKKPARKKRPPARPKTEESPKPRKRKLPPDLERSLVEFLSPERPLGNLRPYPRECDTPVLWRTVQDTEPFSEEEFREFAASLTWPELWLLCKVAVFEWMPWERAREDLLALSRPRIAQAESVHRGRKPKLGPNERDDIQAIEEIVDAAMKVRPAKNERRADVVTRILCAHFQKRYHEEIEYQVPSALNLRKEETRRRALIVFLARLRIKGIRDDRTLLATIRRRRPE